MGELPHSNNVEIMRMQYIAIAGSVFLLFFILNLIRTKRIKEEYSLIWLLLALVFMVFSFWRKGLDYVSEAMGVAYPPAALFLVLLMAVFMILIQFSTIISNHAESIKNLTQEQGLTRFEIDSLKRRIKELEKEHGDS